MRAQKLASRRLMLIKAPSEATNLIAAHVNVGTGTGAKAGAATSVGGMRNTFNQFSWFWKIDKTYGRASHSAGVHVPDFHAEVCSRQDTPLTLERLIADSSGSSGAETT